MLKHPFGVRALIAAVLFALTAGALLAPSADAKKKKLSSGALQESVTFKGVNQHLKSFQRQADAYGDRFSGNPGYDASAAYALKQLRKAGLEAWYEPFEYDAYFQNSPAQLSHSGTAKELGTDFDTIEYAGPGDVTGTAVRSESLGCAPEELPQGTAEQIVLIKRGTCSFRAKVENAAARGFGAALIVNNQPGVPAGTLQAQGGASKIPVLATTPELGEAVANGDELRVVIDSVTRKYQTNNVIAETKGGDPSNVVVAGAHLDGALGGAGMNDNGAGAAALLEVARQVPKFKAPKNKLRFALWGAEESGLIGSTYHVNRMSPAELMDISLYLNFDMIGSSNYGRFVYDGANELGNPTQPPPGSDAIAQNLSAHFARTGLTSALTEFSGRSDYAGFIERGIPSGGLFTGAEGVKTEREVELFGGILGAPYDPNYHAVGDDYWNLDLGVVDQMSDAIADSVALYGKDTSSVDDRDQGAFGALSRQETEYYGDKQVR